MSHYINSFLIEPVIRQARRFSRPSEEEVAPHPVSQLLPEDSANPRVQFQPNTIRESTRWRSTHEYGGPHVPITPTPDDEVFESESEGGRQEVVEGALSDDQQYTLPLRRQEGPLNGDPAVADDSDHLGSDDGVSSNPVYGVPESLRSTASSLSNSAPTVADSDPQAVEDTTREVGRNTRDTERHHTQGREGRLPADDGMGLMRKQIVAIQRTNSSGAEKARMVHDLMTEQYNSSQSSLHAPHTFRARSPASLASQERPFTPDSLRSLESNNIHCTSPPTYLSSVAQASNPFNLTLEDLKPTFYQKPSPIPANPDSQNRLNDRLSDDLGEDPKALGCPHYKRNIKLQCSACYRWYTCRFCHDEVEDHSLNRRETKNMLCMLCVCAQSASEECSQCGEPSARYYCSVCKLWDDDPGKSIYHCNDCGICRIGQGLGKDFYHCKVRHND